MTWKSLNYYDIVTKINEKSDDFQSYLLFLESDIKC